MFALSFLKGVYILGINDVGMLAVCNVGVYDVEMLISCVL